MPGAWFDAAAVEKVLRQLGALRHTKGKWAGTPLTPDLWQIIWIIAPVFGWKHPDGTRIVRVVWIEVPRKNGKSTLSSGLAIVLLCGDGEQGAEVYSAAGSVVQAGIVFGESSKMAKAAPALRKKLRILKRVIEVPATNSIYRVLSRLADLQFGLNVSGAVIDEVHVHKSRDLIDAIETGTGAREQPLVIEITTADEGNLTGIYDEKHTKTIRLAKGIIRDPTFYGVIWAARESEGPDSPGDDPFAEATWKRANPGYGLSLNPAYIRAQAQTARDTPTYLATFLRLHLNVRQRATSRWMPLAKWDATAGTVDPEQLVGRHCYSGLDLSSTIDLSAVAHVFPAADGFFDCLVRFWTPEATVIERSRREGIPYDLWVREGLIEATPGDVIDYGFIRQRLQEDAERFRIREVGFDPWNATQLVQQLQDEDGFTMVRVGQGYASMSAPMKELMRLVLARLIRHGGNPVLRWMADNLQARQDAAGNVKPDREASTGKIDGMVALIMALDRALRNENPDEPSIYETQRLLVL